MKILSLNELEIIRFKLSKLLQTKEKRIYDIKFNDDDSVRVLSFPIVHILFKDINEIETDFKELYPNTLIPDRLMLVSNNDCVNPANTDLQRISL